jgi:hypothetical protein
MSDDSVKETASYGRRAASYWSVDGLPEILRGLMFIVLTGVGLLWRSSAPKFGAGFHFGVLFLGLPVYFFLVERVVLDSLKSRITYPRTGYVEPPERLLGGTGAPAVLSLRSAQPFLVSPFTPSGSENVTFFWTRTVTPLFAVAGLCMLGRDLLGRWLLPLAMPALAVTLYVANRIYRTSDRPYPWWSVLILALTGPAFLWVNVPTRLRWTPLFLVTGAWLLAQGVYALVHYMRANPYPQTAEGVKA